MERLNAVSTSFFGKGSIKLLSDELKKRGHVRALIVTDKFMLDSGTADKVGEKLLEAGLEYSIYYNVAPNPSTTIVNECTYAAKALKVDVLVALGGGSAIDTCKAVSILTGNGGKIEDYEGDNKSKVKGIPVVAINTTAGTGSDVTDFYVVTDPVRHSKMVMADVNCLVDIAVNDVDFMMGMPKSLTAATGMDAMTHSIEAIFTKGATPLTDKDALWSIKVINEYLPRAYAEGQTDVKAREMMAYAQNIAGMAFSNAGLGLVHAMAHSMGGFYNLPHGVCNAVLLPFVLDKHASYPNLIDKFEVIADAMDMRDLKGKEAAVAVIRRIIDLNTEFSIPTDLKSLEKFKHEDIGGLAELAEEDFCMVGNPEKLSKSEIMDVYENAYKGIFNIL